MGSKNLGDSGGFGARLVDALGNACRTIVGRITGIFHSVMNIVKRGGKAEFRPRVLNRPTFRKTVIRGAPLPNAHNGLIGPETVPAEEPPADAGEEGWLNALSEVVEEITIVPAETADAAETPADPFAIEPLAFAAGPDDDCVPMGPGAAECVQVPEVFVEGPLPEVFVEGPLPEVFVEDPIFEKIPAETSVPEEPAPRIASVPLRKSSIRLDSPLARVLSTPTGSGAGTVPSGNFIFDFDSMYDWDASDADAEIEEAEDLVSEVPDMPPALVSIPPSPIVMEADVAIPENDASQSADAPWDIADVIENPASVAEEPADGPSDAPAEGISYDGDFSAFFAMGPITEEPADGPSDAPAEGISYDGDFSAFFAMGPITEEPAEGISYDGDFSAFFAMGPITEEPVDVPPGTLEEVREHDFSAFFSMDAFAGDVPAGEPGEVAAEDVSYDGDFSAFFNMNLIAGAATAVPTETPASAVTGEITFDGDFSAFFSMDAFAGDVPAEACAEECVSAEDGVWVETIPIGSEGTSVAGFSTEPVAKDSVRMSAPAVAIPAPARVIALPAAREIEPLTYAFEDVPAQMGIPVTEGIEGDFGIHVDVSVEPDARAIWVAPPEPLGTGITFGINAAGGGGTGISFSFCKGDAEPEESVEELSECFVPVPESVHACAPSTGFRLML